MKVKRKDKLFCGVNENVIKSRSPIFNEDAIKMLCFYIKERYSIHIKKDVNHENSPWTDDYILGTFKFTNIRREHDRTSKWLIENISNNSRDTLYNRIYKTILFRIYNRSETAEILKLSSLDFDNEVQDGWLYICKMRLDSVLYNDSNYRFFTNAYKTGGTKKGLYSAYPESENYNYSPLYLIEDLRKKHFAQKLIDCNTQEDVFNELVNIKGFGKFIAYQIFVDLTYINEFPFSENEFTVAGPGCYYGIQLLTGKDDKDTGFNCMTTEEILFWMRDNLIEEFNKRGFNFNPVEIFSDLPESERHFNVMSLENIMCEFSKYYAIYTGVRKGRMKYKPNRS